MLCFAWNEVRDRIYVSAASTTIIFQPQILCCQGFVKHYGFTLDALTLKLSGVCNVTF
jgi:hypothetical protein